MARFRVVIRAFTLRRDVASAYLLKGLLERKGCNVIIACSRDFERTLRFWRPHAVVINTVSQIQRCAEIAPGTRIVFLPGEGAKDRPVSDAMMLKDQPKLYDMVDLYLLWGRTSERQYHELLPDKDHRSIAVCGNPRLDLVKFNPGLTNAPAAAKTIGFVGRYHHINRFNGVSTIYSLQLLDRREGVIWQVENFSCMISLMYRILDETNLRISIRPHPLEAPVGYSFMNKGPFKGRVEIDESLDMAAWAAQQSVIIAPSSTSLYEPYLLGVPVINMDGIHGNAETIQRLEPAAALLQEACHMPTNEGDAIAMIKRGVEPRPRSEKLDQNLDEIHNWCSSDSATNRAAEEISALVGRCLPGLRLRLPAAALDLWDRASFHRAYRRDALHVNFSYHRHHHPTPGYFETIIANILAGNSILEQRPH